MQKSHHVDKSAVEAASGRPPSSQKPDPMDAGLAALLLDWRKKCLYNQETDYVFASAEKHGKQPLWPSSAMAKHIRPAAESAGITKHVRWHVFRHSFATLLKGNGEDVKTVQESTAARGQQSNAGHVYTGPHASEKRSTTQGYCDDWNPRGPTHLR